MPPASPPASSKSEAVSPAQVGQKIKAEFEILDRTLSELGLYKEEEEGLRQQRSTIKKLASGKMPSAEALQKLLDQVEFCEKSRYLIRTKGVAEAYNTLLRLLKLLSPAS